MARRRWKKRVGVMALVLIGGIALCVGTGWMLLRGTPAWYRPAIEDPLEREAAANRANQKVAETLSWAAELQAAETRRRRGTSSTQPAHPDSRTVRFTEQELNAAFAQWVVLGHRRNTFEKYLKDPVLILRPQRIILAGRIRDFDAVASFHVQPRLDDQGRLHLDLVRVLGGKLPLPEALFSSYRQKLTEMLGQRLAGWQQAARIEENGSTNGSAVAAAMAKLALCALRHEPGEAVLFVPLDHRYGVPVKLADVRVEDKNLELTIEPLSAEERAALLRSIREAPSGVAARAG